MKKNKLKILDIQRIGHVETRFILDEHGYKQTVAEFRVDKKTQLPDYKKLKKARWGFNDLRILVRRFELLIYEKHGCHHYKFAPGFFTDLASVPKFFRSVVDNDEKELILAALVHDANFANWRKWKVNKKSWLNFRSTNTLFYHMIKYAGGSTWLAIKCWLAVSSFVGKRRWKMRRPAWCKKGVTYEFIKK